MRAMDLGTGLEAVDEQEENKAFPNNLRKSQS